MINKKIGYLGIIARMGSQRLVDKHMIEINQQPIIQYLIDRLSFHLKEEINKNKLQIVILTGSKNKNKLLENIANIWGIKIFYGNDDNIPLRMIDFLKYTKGNFIIPIDGDDILCSPEGIKSIIGRLNEGEEYIQTRGLPFGMNSMGLTTKFLEDSINYINREKLETGWGWIFNKEKCYYIDYELIDERLRFTLDYLEDLHFFENIILNKIDIISISTKDIIDLVIRKKYYLTNQEINKMYWTNFNKQQKMEMEE